MSRTWSALALVIFVFEAACSAPPPAVAEHCPTGLATCGAECANLKSDPNHCGSCGTKCGSGTACAAGACLPTVCGETACAAGDVCQAGSCTAIACVGVACGAGETCDAGACVCAPGFEKCGGLCVDLQTSSDHCGRCDLACQATESCAAGRCYAQNCSDEECLPGEVCVQGVCREASCVGVECLADQKCAGGLCVSCAATGTDDDCASCGDQCRTGTSCANGRCVPIACGQTPCAVGEVCDGDKCVAKACFGVACDAGTSCDPATGQCVSCGSLDTDANCGACGASCGADASCSRGRCLPHACGETTCAAGMVCDGTACVPVKCAGVDCPSGEACDPSSGECTSCGPLTTDENCGACGAACAVGSRCAAGACYPITCGSVTCGANEVCAEGACVEVDCLGVHCGSNEACVGGQCACAEGFDRCGGSSCAPLDDDLNCGACGKACGTGEHCSGGSCVCADGRTACASGCVDTTTDAANCGACGASCPLAGETCSGGKCACPTGTKACGTACLDVQSDNLNCGGCGSVCSSAKTCLAGTCVAPVVCQTNFDDTAAAGCNLVPLDVSACGASGQEESATEYKGTITNHQYLDVPVNPNADDMVEVTGYASPVGSQSAFDVNILDSARNSLADDYQATDVAGKYYDVQAYGAVDSCDQPAFVRFYAGVFDSNYDVVVHVFPRDGANTGATTPGEAPTLASLEGGRTCAQLCGSETGTRRCGEPQFWKVTIPAHGALDFDWSGVSLDRSGSDVSLDAVDSNGSELCGLLNLGVYSRTAARARLVNNLPVPNTVWLRLTSSFGALDDFDLAVAEEK